MSALRSILPIEGDPVGPYDEVIDAFEAQIPVLVGALGLVVVAALGIVFVKWGVPQLVSFFKRTAK